MPLSGPMHYACSVSTVDWVGPGLERPQASPSADSGLYSTYMHCLGTNKVPHPGWLHMVIYTKFQKLSKLGGPALTKAVVSLLVFYLKFEPPRQMTVIYPINLNPDVANAAA